MEGHGLLSAPKLRRLSIILTVVKTADLETYLYCPTDLYKTNFSFVSYVRLQMLSLNEITRVQNLSVQESISAEDRRREIYIIYQPICEPA